MRVLSCYPLLGRVHFYLKQPKSNKSNQTNQGKEKGLAGRIHTTMTKIFGQSSLKKKKTKQEKGENLTKPALHLKLGFKNHIHANHPTSKHCSQRIRSSTYTPNYPHIHNTG